MSGEEEEWGVAGFGTRWPIAAFWGLILNRLLGELLGWTRSERLLEGVPGYPSSNRGRQSGRR